MIQAKQLNCPKCGSPLDLKSAKSKSAVCPSCNSQIDLTGPPFQVMGNVGSRPTPKMTPFTIGMRGSIDGEDHAVIGRVRYTDDEDAWDEWLLLTASGDYRWISEDEDEGMILWHSFTPSQPVDPNTIGRSSTFDLGEGPARVRERGSASIAYVEGELTWKASVGETMQYIDAEGGGTLYSIEWTPDEIEFWRGKRLDAREVAAAFGIAASAVSSPAGLVLTGAGALIGLIVCVLLLCAVVAGVGGSSSSSQGAELVCNTPAAGTVSAIALPTPTEDLSAEDTDQEAATATPPPNCYYRSVSSGPGVSSLFSSIRSGSSGRSISGSGK